LLIVTGVGFLIHIYSVGYMEHEGGYYRFFAYLNIFMFFMLTLILANNYLLMFVGWEGVGLASYLLIGFWFLKDSAANAGKKAFITNRVGDFAFLIAMFLMVKHFGTLQYDEVFHKLVAYPVEASAGLLTAIGLLMMVGASGKSAQIPLYVWLPDAMEGPTPVSALIHAATMVTAGVYMVARSNGVYDRATIALMYVAVIGTLTAIFAASIGILQTDIKKVLAYSTVSQLGYMFMGCGVAAYGAGVFHLMTHAFFKALLFLSAGAIIHGLGGEQDMRNMGGLRKYMPKTFWVMTVATFTIAGFPPLAAFFSKDEILWKTWASGNHVMWLIGLIAAGMTSFYMFRLWFMTFFGEYRGETAANSHDAHDSHGGHGHAGPHESPMIMIAPLVVLAVLSFVGGWVGVPAVLGGSDHFDHFLAPVFHSTIQAAPGDESAALPAAEHEGHEDAAMEYLLMGLSVAAAAIGFLGAWFLYYKRTDLPAKMAAAAGGLYRLVFDKYRIDELYGAAIIHPIVLVSTNVLWKGVDATLIDGTVNGAAAGAQDVSDGLRHMQSGNLRSYAGWVAFGAAVVIAFMVWKGVR
jgi:NADH-quinone oxidoreductase subunit L